MCEKLHDENLIFSGSGLVLRESTEASMNPLEEYNFKPSRMNFHTKIFKVNKQLTFIKKKLQNTHKKSPWMLSKGIN